MRAFIDIDTQIDFVFPAGALYGAGAERFIPAVAALNAHAANNGIPLISTTCAHPEDAAEFRVWPPHCVVGTVGQRKPAVTLQGDRQIIVEKNDLDMFSNPDVLPLLDRLRIDECFVYGVFTEYCVKCAVMGLLASRRKVHLIADATGHLNDDNAREVIDSFHAAGGRSVSLSEVLSYVPSVR